MGSNSYPRDIFPTSSAGSFDKGTSSSSYAHEALNRSSSAKETSPFKRQITSVAKAPIVILLDETGSNREFCSIVYDKAPLLHGEIEAKEYVPDFDICFSVFGDADTDSDPLQVAEFARGIVLDEWLKKMFLEGNGGGHTSESAELAAYFFANYCSMPNATHPFLFLITDELPYASLNRRQVRDELGRDLQESITTKEVFAQLQKTFQGNVFILVNAYQGRRSNGKAYTEFSKEWIEFIGQENASHVILIQEEKSFVDIILGVISMVSQSRTLNGYLEDMSGRGQTEERIDTVSKSLTILSRSIVPVAGSNLPTVPPTSTRKSGSKRV